MTNQNIGSSGHFRSTILATMAIVCFSYAGSALILLHWLRRDYAARSHMISDYGVGPYGWVMSTCFVALGCGVVMLVLGLWRSGPGSRVARIGTVLLGIAAIGLVVSAIFPTDLPGGPRTRAGEIHTVSFLVNIGSIILGTALLSLSFGSDYRWRTYRRTALMLVSLILIAFILQFLTLHRGMPYGYTNRLLVITLGGWFFGTSMRLRTIARDSASQA